MASVDALVPFQRVNPLSKDTVSVREFVDLQLRLEQTINTLQRYTRTLVPEGSYRWAKLTASQITGWFDENGRAIVGKPWEGWQVSNGSNGTEDLSDKFFMGSTTAAGATGGTNSDVHIHSVNLPNFTGNTGSEAAHVHGTADTAVNGTLRARIDVNSADDKIYADASSTSGFTADRETTAGTLTVDSSTSARDLVTNIQGITDSGTSHLHTLDHNHPATDSAVSSVSDKRPAYYAAVILVRI
jgi:hypothetical protein